MKNRQFDWDNVNFNNMNKVSYNFAEKIIELKLIHDVYMDVEKELIVIEHLIDCKYDLKNIDSAATNIQNKEIRPFYLPIKLKIDGETSCSRKAELDCTFVGCPIIIASYIYHNRFHLKKDVHFKGLGSDEDDYNEIVEEMTKPNNEKVLTDDEKEKYKDILDKIDSNIYIHPSVKKDIYNIITRLINHVKFKDSFSKKPSLNFALMEDTDTLNSICLAQRESINLLKEILVHFNILDNANEKEKFIDFKEINEKDFLKEENYSEKIIILHNIYYLGSNIDTEVNNEYQLQVSKVKNKFPSFILNNKDKIFIICDKKINIENFYRNLPQVALLFEKIFIPEFTKDEIYEIMINKLKNPKFLFEFEENFDDKFKKYIDLNYMYSPYKNLEFIDFIFNDFLKSILLNEESNKVYIQNFHFFKMSKNEDYLNLENLIGLDNVKTEIKNLKSYLQFKNERALSGGKMPQLDLHMTFLGNPGTGKTTVARLMAGILFDMGYIRYNKCLEVEAKDLIANIPGQTSIKTYEKIQDALGGILFIDEAYALMESEYGKECVATLIKSMEDYRDDLVVILAGYHKEMLRFLEINSGFKSRIAYYFDFKDYSTEELLQMTEKLLKDYGFSIKDSACRSKLGNLYTAEKRKGSDFGNSRFVRNTVDKILRQHAINLSIRKRTEDEDINVITSEDVY